MKLFHLIISMYCNSLSYLLPNFEFNPSKASQPFLGISGDFTFSHLTYYESTRSTCYSTAFKNEYYESVGILVIRINEGEISPSKHSQRI